MLCSGRGAGSWTGRDKAIAIRSTCRSHFFHRAALVVPDLPIPPRVKRGSRNRTCQIDPPRSCVLELAAPEKLARGGHLGKPCALWPALGGISGTDQTGHPTVNM